MSSLLSTATIYRDAGLSVIGSSKKGSVITWKQYQTRRPTDEELHYFFVTRAFPMLAIICGEASGNLEVIDVDTKNDPSKLVWEKLWDRILDYYKGNPPFALVQTPSGGMHLYYRCETIEISQKLAYVMVDGAPQTIIETRGLKGLVMAPPTAGYKPYDDMIPSSIPTITPDERDDILTICREFNEVFDQPEEHAPRVRSAITYKVSPWSEYNAADEWKTVLQEAGWTFTHASGVWDYWRRPDKDSGHSASWNRETRQFYVFSSSTGFITQKAYRPFDILKIVRHNGDVRKAVVDAKKAGFGANFSGPEEEFIGKAVSLFNSGNLMDDIRDMLAFDFEAAFRNQRDVSMDQLLEAAESRSIDGQGVFWIEDDNGNLKLEISALSDFLRDRGYRRLYDNEYALKYHLVHVDPATNQMRYIDYSNVKSNVHASLFEVSHKTSLRKLRNLVISLSDETFKKAIDILPVLAFDQIKILNKAGDESTQWFSFANGAVQVTPDEIKVVPYSEIPRDIFMWKKDIKSREFQLSDIELEEEFNQSVVWRFFKRIVGITPDLDHLDHEHGLPKSHPELANRFLALLSTIGYLLSTYKDVDQTLMPIFEEDIMYSGKGGGTGKRLIFTIIGFLRTVEHPDCKTWRPDMNFAYDIVKPDTDIIHFEDYEPWSWPISRLNNVISGDLNIVYKYEGTFTLKFKNSPKCAMSTNYKVPDDAEFEARRQHKIYLSRYFSKEYRPKHEFGKKFGVGEDWTEFDWHISDNILIYCLQRYLKGGIVEFPTTENVRRKGIIDVYGQDFLDFMDNFVKTNKGKWVQKKKVHHDFLEEAGADKRRCTLKWFEKACKAFGKQMGLEYLSERNNSRTVGERDQFYIIFGEPGVEYPFSEETVKTCEFTAF